jgi:two-component system, NtrC family, response regulator AtoC
VETCKAPNRKLLAQRITSLDPSGILCSDRWVSIQPELSSAESAGSGYQLLVVSGDQLRSFSLPQQGEVSIGRDETSTIYIDHPSVSRVHARLVLGAKVLVEDLGGANGTFVRDPSKITAPGQTQPLRRLVNETSELRVGEQLLFGAVGVVLRELPTQPQVAVVQSEAMREIYAEVSRIARSTLSVLLLGETGVGKEVVAHAVHEGSPRAGQPFLAINCAALGESTLEGELFGYERGSFTGAVQARPGLFEAADRGSVFLDEIGDLPLPIQAKLLRVLEERRVLRLGARSTRSVDIRIIAATNRDLDADVAGGRFRRDLLYRLNAVVFNIPPLRERPAEVAALAETFVAAICEQLRRPKLSISAELLVRLTAHPWPGNVRELKNVIERAAVLCDGPELGLEHLPRAWSAKRPDPLPASEEPGGPFQLRGDLQTVERNRILAALDRCGGNQTRAAQMLGISRRTLVNRMSQFQLPRPKEKPRG